MSTSTIPETKTNLSISYQANYQMLKFEVVGEDNKPVHPSWNVHLSELLCSIGTSKEDCLEALGQANLPDTLPIVDEVWDTVFGIQVLPPDLTGKTVLDIGGYTGVMAKAARDRGARRVVVLDNSQYLAYTSPGFPYGWRRPVRYKDVEYVYGSLADFDAWPADLRRADLVICYNVIYHVPNPLGALATLRAVATEELLIQTSFRDGDDPVWWFSPDESGTIFFTPTCAGLEAGLRYAGFVYEKVRKMANRIIYRCH